MIFRKNDVAQIDTNAAAQTWLTSLHQNGYTPRDVVLKATPHIGGFGVFANRDFKKGEVVELCPAFDAGAVKDYQNNSNVKNLLQYLYWFEGKGMIISGYGSMYNCADKKRDANIEYTHVPEHRLHIFYTIKNVKKGEELLTWWGLDYYYSWCKRPGFLKKILLLILRGYRSFIHYR